ncbi:hypothetical protein ACJ41O_010939 [Fusarium nematophilum]
MAAPACWTCRLRRKKCDRVRPACTSCADLSIDCHYSAVRPDWMDGGRRQSDMAESIKAQVKQGAAARREREFAVQVLPLGDNATKQASTSSRVDSPPSTASSAAPVHSSSLEETDDFLTTLYLDTVFPFLFPWYQPTDLAGGRTWLLAMIKDQKAIRHTAISISAYYFALSLARDASHTLRTPCEQHVWDTLALHMDSSVQIIQQDMKDFNKARLSSQTKPDIFQQTHLLEAIVQQLIFDTVMAQGADWNMHLTAASALLCDIFESHGVKNGRYDLGAVLLAMQQKWPVFEGVDLGFSVWTADQAAFQFFAAFLIFADVISSISLRAPPQLQRYHRFLISDDHPLGDPQSSMLQMGDYIGCPGWVVVLLGEICVLEMWKLGGLSNVMEEEVRNQEGKLRARLEEGLAGMQSQSAHTTKGDAARAWIRAALLYLGVVEQGWQPSHPTVTNHVQSIVDILRSTPSQRSIMWPFFMAGCLAGEEQEAVFRDVVSNMGPLQAFGTAREALGLMERMWSLRDVLDRDSWGLSNCFSGQGGHVLLI